MARPVSFDREQVLERATAVFWERGFCETSMSQLVDATRLQPGSLYAAFRSKEGLFLEALDHYAERSREQMRASIEAAEDPLQGIRDVFTGLPVGSGMEARRGCLLVNSVLEAGRLNPAVQARVKSHLAKVEAIFRNALERAQANGALAPGKSPAKAAKFLMTTLWGLRVLGGTGASRQSARDVIDEALGALRC